MTLADPDELASYRDGGAWADGPQAVYDRLAAVALSGLPERLDGLAGLDVGAGTGAATRELLRRGARVVAVDQSTSMLDELRRQTAGRVPTLVSDIRALALPDDEYDVTVAAFVLNHLDDAAGGIRELVRVTRPGGRVVATTFSAEDHPMKGVIDEVLARHGFVHPQWYRTVKKERIPLIATIEAFRTAGRNGGLADAAVEEVTVDFSDLPTRSAIGYRLGLAHIAPFFAGLEPAHRALLDVELDRALTGIPPLQLTMLVLNGWS